MYRFLVTLSVRIGLRLIAIFLAACALAGIALLIIFQSAQFRHWAQAELSQRSGFEIQVAQLGFRLPFTMVADAVKLSRPGELVFTAGRLTATVGPFDVLSKTLHRVRIEKPVLQLDIDGLMKSPTKASTALALRHLNVHDGTIVLKKGEATVFELPKIDLAAENLNLGQGGSGVSLRADVPPLNGEAELSMTGRIRDLETEIVLRPKQSSNIFRGSDRTSRASEWLRLRAKFHAPENQKADLTIAGKLQNLPMGDGRITGGLDARLEVDAGWTVAAFSGSGVVSDFPNAVGLVALGFPSANAATIFAGTFSIPGKTVNLKSLQITSALGTCTGDGEIRFDPQPTIAKARLSFSDIPMDNLKTLLPSPLNQWLYQGQGQMELNLSGPWTALEVTGSARSESLQLRGGNMSVGNLSMTAPFKWTNSTLSVAQARLVATKLAYLGTDRWHGAAERTQLDASFDFKADKPLMISGQFATTGGKFTSPDSSKAGENLTVSGPFQLAFRPEKNSPRLTGKFTAPAGEILWGKFFGDLKTQRPVLEFDSDYIRDEDRLECRRCNLNLANVGSVDIAGSIDRLTQTPTLRLVAHSANFSPGGFFDFFLLETFKRQYPLLDRVAVGGQMVFQLQLEGTLDRLAVGGEISLKSGDLRAKSNDWHVGPIALTLPFLVHLSDNRDRSSGGPKAGVLSIGNARFGKHSLGPLSAPVSLSNNSLRFHQTLRLEIFDGVIVLNDLFWPDVINDPKRVSFSAEAKRLQLEELTEALNWHRFSGTLTGSIPKVQSTEGLLQTQGEIEAEVFGGRARIGKFEIGNPFSSLASIRLDAKLNNIQLEQLSKTFEFGRISGILEGSIGELVLIEGQPSELRADFHSVEQSGTEQRISVEAINKITVLSSGQNAGALYGGLASFFDSFRYSKLGFKATLRNDRLTLRGVETRGDQEFLVVGSFLPPTVNIISHTQEIAFSELLRRLERIKSDNSSVK